MYFHAPQFAYIYSFNRLFLPNHGAEKVNDFLGKVVHFFEKGVHFFCWGATLLKMHIFAIYMIHPFSFGTPPWPRQVQVVQVVQVIFHLHFCFFLFYGLIGP